MSRKAVHENEIIVRIRNQIFVDLEEDLGPRIRAPPEYLQPFYYLLQVLGAPKVPHDQCPTVMVKARPPAALSDLGVALAPDLRSPNELADVKVNPPSSHAVFRPGLLVAAACRAAAISCSAEPT